MKKTFLRKTMIAAVVSTTITAIFPLGVSAQWENNLDHTWSYRDGNALVKGWINISETWYYFDWNGKMETGWLQDRGNWYYLNSSGEMKKGWIKDQENWYYLSNTGEMETGWVKDQGKWYYLDNDGAMRTGNVSIGDKTYYLSNSGELHNVVDNSNQQEENINNSKVEVSGLAKLPENYSVIVQESAEGKILELMNEKRVEAGLTPLVLDNVLLQVARYKSNDMIQNNYFDHTTPQGEKWINWLDAVGYKYTTTGENIAYNNYDPVELFNQWWNSPGHKANMMNPSYTKVGIGVLNGNWKYMGTQTFAN